MTAPYIGATYRRRFLSVRERFESWAERVPIAGCWIWTGVSHIRSKYRLQYGKFFMHGRTMVAHRAAWAIYRGEIPTGTLVCHLCDVPECVNPDHLFLSTHKGNTSDMQRKGRNRPMLETRRGQFSNWNKLTPEQVIAIRAATGKQRDIARQFGVSQSCVSLIKRGINWKHL